LRAQFDDERVAGMAEVAHQGIPGGFLIGSQTASAPETFPPEYREEIKTSGLWHPSSRILK
jgi:hypothetical protein